MTDRLPGTVPVASGAGLSLDDLFRGAAERDPNRIALSDAPNRSQFTDGTPRVLTYAQADRIVSAIAARLRSLGLAADAVIAVQMPNCVEAVLTLLGIWRAGMIAAPMPLLWRQREMTAALWVVGAKALIVCGRVGATDHATLAMQTAADVFSIRHVCAFGADPPDGVVGLDDLLDGIESCDDVSHDAEHPALITFDTAAEGPLPLARDHAAVLAAGSALLLEGGFGRGAVFVSALLPTSFAGIAVGLVPWLLSAGTLRLHQPFDPEGLAAQLCDGCDVAVLPAPIIPRLKDAGLLPDDLSCVVGYWRAPERIDNAPAWTSRSGFVDVACFGEAGLVASSRGTDGKPAPLPLGFVTAPRASAGAVVVADLARSRQGTLVMYGPMVPRRLDGDDKTEGEDSVDTGFPCRSGPDAGSLTITGPPPGIAAVGGYRFALRDIQNLVGQIDRGAHLAALPDALVGQRLAGAAGDRKMLRAALVAEGVNPLVAEAFV